MEELMRLFELKQLYSGYTNICFIISLVCFFIIIGICITNDTMCLNTKFTTCTFTLITMIGISSFICLFIFGAKIPSKKDLYLTYLNQSEKLESDKSKLALANYYNQKMFEGS